MSSSRTGPVFAALADAEPGTFYLTDFLLRHFERLVIRGLGSGPASGIVPAYFGNYRRLVYLAQAPGAAAVDQARAIAARMGLAFEFNRTGYGTLETRLAAAVTRHGAGQNEADGQHEKAVARVR